jgi:hypothetical protein
MTTTSTEHHANLEAAISTAVDRALLAEMDPKEVLEVLQVYVRNLAAEVEQRRRRDSKNG